MKTTILAVALASIGIHHQSFAEEVPPPSDGQAGHAVAPSTVPTERSEKDFIGADDDERNWQETAQLVVSKLGYDAVVVRPSGHEGEGCVDTVIMAGDRLLARLAYARPLMFSPEGDYLLLTDAIDGDEGHNFIVDVLGLDRREVPLQRHAFGRRHTQNLRWSKDGQIIRAGDSNFGPDFSKDYPLAEILGEDAMNRSAGANRPRDKEYAELTRQSLLNQIAAISQQMKEAKEPNGWRDGIEINMVRDNNRERLNELNRQLAWTNRQLAAIERYEASYRPFMENIRLEKRMFSGTTDGITDEELKILNQKKESANWKITESKPGKITTKSKNAESVVSVQRYPIQSGSESEMAVFELIHTNNLQAVTTTGMRLSSQLADSFPKVPVVSINDFFAEGDQVADPEKYQGNVVMQLRPDGSLSYDIFTKMEDELAKKRKVYNITAHWNGSDFHLAKAKLQEPAKD